ncbi:hypothetical protein QR674_06535 [Acinetobacter chinensis]|uniref:Uncharacterized protein n=1 Tax=Acinetobacter chinensis TaxID=2004650 RepID=A0ABU3WE04_9GAMM|nr:hypothetical protein [Acinetobacter chinensis]MDV2468635.1 hypothetical protein [Acinetobacter chinensis]
MTRFILENIRWEITDNVFDRSQWTGLSQGEVWTESATAWGFYFAKWTPNQHHDLKLMLIAVNDTLNADLVIGFTCAVDKLESLQQDTSPDFPWEDWEGLKLIRRDEFDQYTKASEALIIAKQIIQQDASLAKYIRLTELSLSDHSSAIDQNNSHSILV